MVICAHVIYHKNISFHLKQKQEKFKDTYLDFVRPFAEMKRFASGIYFTGRELL
jgi:hypothetical protein